MYWKCPSCGNEDNSSSDLRCDCGHEITEKEIVIYQIEKTQKKVTSRSSLKSALIVVATSLVIAGIIAPFNKNLPPFISSFTNHQCSFFGYMIILRDGTIGGPRKIWNVAVWVWLLMASLYTLFFLHEIGTKYTASAIIFGGLKSEIISAALALSVHAILNKVSASSSANGQPRP